MSALLASRSDLRVSYRHPSTLTPAEHEAIWTLLDRSVRRDRAAFEEKLVRVQEVFLGHDAAGKMVAFGAVDVIEVEREGETHALIYTHWAAYDPAVRGQNLTQRVGLRCFLRYRVRHPLRRVYWLFTASTFFSYLLLEKNLATFWPRAGVECPPLERGVVEAAMDAIGDPWDREAWLLRRRGASRYREGVVDDAPEVLDDASIGAAVRFYRERNPAQAEGDSLVCLAPLTLANWIACAGVAADRWLRRGRFRPHLASSASRA